MEITSENLEVTGLTSCSKPLESEIPKTEAEGTLFTWDTNLHKDNCPKLSSEGVNNCANNTTVPLHGYVDPTSGNINMFTLNTDINEDTGPQLSPDGIDNCTHLTTVPLHGYVDPKIEEIGAGNQQETSGSINMNKPVYNSQMTASHVESSMVCSKVQALGSIYTKSLSHLQMIQMMLWTLTLSTRAFIH